MIIYGKRRIPKIYENSNPIKCPHCLQTVPLLIVGCLEYAYIFWIPFFGWKTVVYVCSSCEKSLVRGGGYDDDITIKIPKEAMNVRESVRKQLRVPWYYFIGLILLGIFILYMIIYEL